MSSNVYPKEPLPYLIDLPTAAQCLGISVVTLRRRIKAGEFPCVRVGRLVKIDPKAVGHVVRQGMAL